MRVRTSPDGRARRRPAPRTAALTAAAVLLAGVAAPVAAGRALAAHQPLTAVAVCAVAVLWLIAVGLAATATERTRRLAEELTAQQDRTGAALDRAAAAESAEAAAHSRIAAADTAREAARSERADAEAEAGAVRTELARVRSELEAEQAARAALDRLAGSVLPEVVKKLRDGASVDSALAAHRTHPQHALLRALAEEIGRGERLRAAALAVCATAAGRVQALATSMHAELREMQHRHDEEVLGDLLRLDHSTAQAGRMADSIAVLTGARSGRRWAKPIAVESVLRGALGRIGAYRRVRLHNASAAAVAGFAAEGVMHALAELLDNATNFSAPPAEVHVYVEEVPAGLAVTVEDSGLGLSESWLRRAERAVSAEPLDLTTLTAGTRLGLAVVGALARKYGLQISFRPSARGGTGVVVLIPQQLVTHPAPEPAAAPGPVPARGTTPARPALTPALAPTLAPTRAPDRAAAPGAATSAPAPAQVTDSGLPQRRRGQTLATATATATATAGVTATGAPAAKPGRGDAASAAARFGAFRRAAQQAGSGSAPATGPITDPTDTTDTTPDASPVTEKDS
ncbi:sensor histidine kinase [Kitasatospora sp. NPDC091207]|uniref:sensor histidine kinase n=1 Tax=Kitasatospora sp. NPDC091207 TaxID=3364083 RepID=UPI00381A25D4